MGLKFKNYVPMTNSCLGTSHTADDLLQIGERVWNTERIFNMAAGIDAMADTLPDRFTREAIEGGPAEGQVSRVPEMLPEYYQLRGWDANGVPTQKTLDKLGLGFVDLSQLS